MGRDRLQTSDPNPHGDLKQELEATRDKLRRRIDDDPDLKNRRYLLDIIR